MKMKIQQGEAPKLLPPGDRSRLRQPGMKMSEKVGAQDRYRDIFQQKIPIKESGPKLESYMTGSIIGIGEPSVVLSCTPTPGDDGEPGW